MKIADFWNDAMFKAKATKEPNNNKAVVAVQMNHDKNFAFLEFSCPEDATSGMGLDGIILEGNALKVRRPRDYKSEGLVESKDLPKALTAVVSTNVEEGPNKIFVGGLPSYLNEEQVKELVSAFGQLKSFNLVKDSATGLSKGFAFFEYLDGDVTDRACNGLNGMKLGEKTVLVQRANVGAKHQIPKAVGQSILNNPTALNFLNLQMPIAAAAALLDINMTDPGTPTCVVQLVNVVSPADLMDDEDFQEILEDIRDEASRFGHIVSMYIPRPVPRVRDPDGNLIPLLEPMWGVGKVFIEYRKPEEAQKALYELGGRKFSGHTVIAGFFPEDRYIRRDFAPDETEESAYLQAFLKKQEKRELEREMEDEE